MEDVRIGDAAGVADHKATQPAQVSVWFTRLRQANPPEAPSFSRNAVVQCFRARVGSSGRYERLASHRLDSAFEQHDTTGRHRRKSFGSAAAVEVRRNDARA